MRIRRFLIKHCDQITRWLAVVTAVLAGAGTGVLFGSYESNRSADQRVAEVQAINLSLIQTLQQKVTPLVQQQAQVAEQQSALSEKLETTTDRVETAATKSTLAASTASKAASRAGQAARNAREQVGSLRMVPSKPQQPRCRGKDVFGDPCP